MVTGKAGKNGGPRRQAAHRDSNVFRPEVLWPAGRYNRRSGVVPAGRSRPATAPPGSGTSRLLRGPEMHHRRFHVLVADERADALSRTVNLLKRRDHVAAGAATIDDAHWWLSGWPVD